MPHSTRHGVRAGAPTSGNGLYLWSTREGLLSIVAVIVSLYPASTILLAIVLDDERASRSQVVGMGLAVATVVTITLGS